MPAVFFGSAVKMVSDTERVKTLNRGSLAQINAPLRYAAHPNILLLHRIAALGGVVVSGPTLLEHWHVIW